MDFKRNANGILTAVNEHGHIFHPFKEGDMFLRSVCTVPHDGLVVHSVHYNDIDKGEVLLFSSADRHAASDFYYSEIAKFEAHYAIVRAKHPLFT